MNVYVPHTNSSNPVFHSFYHKKWVQRNNWDKISHQFYDHLTLMLSEVIYSTEVTYHSSFKTNIDSLNTLMISQTNHI